MPNPMPRRRERPYGPRLTINELANIALGETGWDEITASGDVAAVVDGRSGEVLTRRQAASVMHLLATISATFADALPPDRREELARKIAGVLVTEHIAALTEAGQSSDRAVAALRALFAKDGI